MDTETTQKEVSQFVKLSCLPRQQEALATVLSLTGNTPNTATVLIDGYGEKGVFLPSFFGGEFAPPPKVGDTLKIKLEWGCSNLEIIEAWVEEPATI